MQRTSTWFLLGILLVALAVRALQLRENPPGFYGDEASVGVNAYALLRTGRDEHGQPWPLLFRAFGEYKLPVFIYSALQFVAALGLREEAIRLTAVAYGVLTVGASYALARRLLGDREALMTALLVAITPWDIHYSRIGFELIAFPFLLSLALALFLSGVSSLRQASEQRSPEQRSPERRWLWPLGGVLFAVCLYTYRSAWTVVPPLLVLLGFLYWAEVRRAPWSALIGLLVVLSAGLPLAAHALSGQDRAMQTSILTLGLGPRETLATFADFYARHFDPGYLFARGDPGPGVRHSLPGYGLLFPWMAPLILVGVIGVVWRRRREDIIVLALLALYPLAGALSDASPISTRTVLGALLFPMLAAAGLSLLLRRAASMTAPWGGHLMVVLVALFVLLGVVNLVQYLARYYREYPLIAAGPNGWQYGPREVIERFKVEAARYDALVLDAYQLDGADTLMAFYAPDSCGKCQAVDLATAGPDLSQRQLFAMRPERFWPAFQYRTVDTVAYPNGEPAFTLAEIVAGTSVDAPSTLAFPTPPSTEAAFGGELGITGIATISRLGRVVLRWEVLRRPAEDYSVSVRAVDDGGKIWAQSDFLLGDWQDRGSQWGKGEVRYTVHDLRLPAGAPAGPYALVAVVYVLGPPLRNVPVLSAGPSAEALALGPLPGWSEMAREFGNSP